MLTEARRGRAPDTRGPAAPEISQAGERRLARIESIRALAALGVVVGHAWGRGHAFGPTTTDSLGGRLLFGGGFGAFMLLALTGYLLYWPFVRRYYAGGARTDLRLYARNRVVRIVPLYVFAIALLLILQEDGGSAAQWWRFALFVPSLWHDTVASVDGPLWTVVVEVHFYILLPLLAAAIAATARGSAGRAAAILTAVCAASLALWMWKVFPTGGDDRLWRYNLPATFYFLGAGMLMALARLAVERAGPRWLEHRLLGSADAWLLASVPLWALVCAVERATPLMTVASVLVLGACVLPLRGGGVLRSLDARWLALLGVASYSLYVWHSPIIEHLAAWAAFPDGTWALFALGIPLTLAATAISYRVIEAPFLRLRRRWATASAPINGR